jgi:hypothetical protein
MEEAKVQALHDTLSKLKKSAGLGVSSHYNFGKIKTTEVDGKVVRADGLPSNQLYFPFVREGTYDKEKSDASRYGDGRVIKRNFDDCNSDGSSNSSNSHDKKKLAKEKKKAKKKAAKLEAKRQAKLDEKRKAKIEEKKRAILNNEMSKNAVVTGDKKKSKKRKVSEDGSDAEKKKSKKSKKKKNGDMDESKKKKSKKSKS